MISRCLALAAVAAFSLACADRSPTGPALERTGGAATERSASASRPSPRSLAPRVSPNLGPIGTWGGEHVNLTIGQASALIEYDCAHGSIDQPFAANAQGQFDVAGTHFPESGGPVRDVPPAAHPARYTGTTDGKTMTLMVTLTDTGQVLGPFTLTLGLAGHIVKCL
jgi:hypothetical protein